MSLRTGDDREVCKMGLSLAEAAVGGMSSSLSGQKRKLLDVGDIDGLLALNRRVFGGFTMKGTDDGGSDDTDDTEDGEDGDDDEDEDDEDEDEDEGKSKKKLDPRDVRIKDLSSEAKRYRLRASSRGKRIKELEEQLNELKSGKGSKPKKEDEDDDAESGASTEELSKAKKDNEALVRRNEDLLIRLEFMGDTRFAWQNPKDALKLLDLDDVEITEDGEVEGLDEAIEELAKSRPYLLKKSKDDEEDDDEDDEDENTKKRKRSTGQKTGSRKKGQPNRDALLKKYPGLRR
jgi:hypothetical protein